MAKSTVTLIGRTPCWGDPPIFRDDHDALDWAIGQGVYTGLVEATAAYAALKERYPQYKVGMGALWMGHVAQQINKGAKQMAFKKMTKTKYPPRQWALVGHPGSGKSTFSAQMQKPILVIDADHRYQEVLHLAKDAFTLSDNPADNVNPRAIHAELQANMGGAGVRTILVDSLTSIMAPIVTEAQLVNAAGESKNKMAPFADKALAMRLLQDAVTAYGTDTLWIWHLRDGRDGSANKQTVASISAVELARLRRSLNLELTIVEDGNKRGVKVTWARRGRSGLTLWDDSGAWVGMPERIEAAVYDGLSQAEQEAIERQAPTVFSGPADAIAWGYGQGCFDDAVHSANAYEKLKTERKPATAAAMWALWVEDVRRRQTERQEPATEGAF